MGFNTFVAGTKIEAAKVNENFQYVNKRKVSIVAGEDITRPLVGGVYNPVPVYLNKSDSKFYRCYGNSLTKVNFIGFVEEDIVVGGTYDVVVSGIVEGFSDFSLVGDEQFVKNDGSLANTRGTYEIFVGYSVNTNTLLIASKDWQYLGDETFSVTISNETLPSANVNWVNEARYVVITATIYNDDGSRNFETAGQVILMPNIINEADCVQSDNSLNISKGWRATYFGGTEITIAGLNYGYPDNPCYLVGTVSFFR